MTGISDTMIIISDIIFITLALDSLAASASAAMALCSCMGSLTSLLNIKTIKMSHFFSNSDSHFDPLDLDPPGVGGHVEGGLHVVRDLLPLRQQLVQTLGAQHIP